MGPRVPNLEIDLALSGTPGFKKVNRRDVKPEGSALNHGGFCCPIRRRNPSPRLVAERSGVLLDRAAWNPRRNAHRMPAFAAIERRTQLLAVAIAEFRPPERLAHRTRSFEAGFRPLTDLFTFQPG
jgi:hypothetical protein